MRTRKQVEGAGTPPKRSVPFDYVSTRGSTLWQRHDVTDSDVARLYMEWSDAWPQPGAPLPFVCRNSPLRLRREHDL